MLISDDPGTPRLISPDRPHPPISGVPIELKLRTTAGYNVLVNG
jgi:hypothetical protein